MTSSILNDRLVDSIQRLSGRLNRRLQTNMLPIATVEINAALSALDTLCKQLRTKPRDIRDPPKPSSADASKTWKGRPVIRPPPEIVNKNDKEKDAKEKNSSNPEVRKVGKPEECGPCADEPSTKLLPILPSASTLPNASMQEPATVPNEILVELSSVSLAPSVRLGPVERSFKVKATQPESEGSVERSSEVKATRPSSEADVPNTQASAPIPQPLSKANGPNASKISETESGGTNRQPPTDTGAPAAQLPSGQNIDAALYVAPTSPRFDPDGEALLRMLDHSAPAPAPALWPSFTYGLGDLLRPASRPVSSMSLESIFQPWQSTERAQSSHVPRQTEDRSETDRIPVDSECLFYPSNGHPTRLLASESNRPFNGSHSPHVIKPTDYAKHPTTMMRAIPKSIPISTHIMSPSVPIPASPSPQTNPDPTKYHNSQVPVPQSTKPVPSHHHHNYHNPGTNTSKAPLTAQRSPPSLTAQRSPPLLTSQRSPPLTAQRPPPSMTAVRSQEGPISASFSPKTTLSSVIHSCPWQLACPHEPPKCGMIHGKWAQQYDPRPQAVSARRWACPLNSMSLHLQMTGQHGSVGWRCPYGMRCNLQHYDKLREPLGADAIQRILSLHSR
jgi:hypothetical protein